MSYECDAITLSREWGDGRARPVVSGSLVGWPVRSAREICSAVAGWSDSGWTEMMTVLTGTIGVHADGAETLLCTPLVIDGNRGAIAGPEWDDALAAILRAQA